MIPDRSPLGAAALCELDGGVEVSPGVVPFVRVPDAGGSGVQRRRRTHGRRLHRITDEDQVRTAETPLQPSVVADLDGLFVVDAHEANNGLGGHGELVDKDEAHFVQSPLEICTALG